jgi:hypothetical protein
MTESNLSARKSNPENVHESDRPPEVPRDGTKVRLEAKNH